MTKPSAGARPYLVYTSAGDASNVTRWLRGRRNFDLWITYYGELPGRYLDIADLANARKGSKMQNLHHAYRTWPARMQSYQAVFVLDDDLVLSGADISDLFDIREHYDLWLLQPAFDPRGRISHRITVQNPRYLLRYTNFVETGCLLFRKDRLDAFMAVYDPYLISYGTDWWVMEVMGPQSRGRVAVVDAVTCVNPLDGEKGGHREIDRIEDRKDRIANWRATQAKHALAGEFEHTVYGGVKVSRVRHALAASILAMRYIVAIFRHARYLPLRRWPSALNRRLSRNPTPCVERIDPELDHPS